MMAITEETVVAGIMTFFLYGVLPTLIILYVGGTSRRRLRRQQQAARAMEEKTEAVPAHPTQRATEARERNDAS